MVQFFWLIIAGICFVIESFTVGFFVFWFGIGALIALFVSLFITSFFIQVITFIVASTLLLLLTKPLMKKFTKPTHTVPTNVYSVIGKEGIVIEDIDTVNCTGKVKVHGELWSAISDNNIEKDSKIKVVAVNGVKLKVEKIDSTIVNL
jgi:membrane protein implicated in regulation of membrane protease activity